MCRPQITVLCIGSSGTIHSIFCLLGIADRDWFALIRRLSEGTLLFIFVIWFNRIRSSPLANKINSLIFLFLFFLWLSLSFFDTVNNNKSRQRQRYKEWVTTILVVCTRRVAYVVRTFYHPLVSFGNLVVAWNSGFVSCWPVVDIFLVSFMPVVSLPVTSNLQQRERGTRRYSMWNERNEIIIPINYYNNDDEQYIYIYYIWEKKKRRWTQNNKVCLFCFWVSVINVFGFSNIELNWIDNSSPLFYHPNIYTIDTIVIHNK